MPASKSKGKVLLYQNGVNTIECFMCNDKPVKKIDNTHKQPCYCPKCHYIQCHTCEDTRVLFAIRCYECMGKKEIDYGYRDDGHGQWCSNWQECKTCQGTGLILVRPEYQPKL